MAEKHPHKQCTLCEGESHCWTIECTDEHPLGYWQCRHCPMTMPYDPDCDDPYELEKKAVAAPEYDITVLAVLDPGGCPCGYEDGQQGGCLCAPAERVLRLYAGGQQALATLTPDQREACLCELHRVEGYSRADYVEATDQELCRGVLYAWADFCRDKGLL